MKPSRPESRCPVSSDRVDGLAIFVANLDGQFIFGAIENVNAIEVGGFRNTFDFVRRARSLFLMESRSSEELVPFFA